MNLLREEKKLWKKGKGVVAGFDEAGRGPLAGPVMAAAVMVDKKKINREFGEILTIIKDSKKLSFKKREEIFKKIYSSKSIIFSWARVSENIIDKINILEATRLAMIKALRNLEKRVGKRADFLLIDGNFKIDVNREQKSIVRGDEKVFSIMAASIIAKVKRDRLMIRYHKKYPQYGFDRHKGYGTKYHKKMIRKFGPSKIHRKTFRGVK